MESIKNIQELDSEIWDDSFLINIPLLDNQHKKLFAVFDELEALNNEGGNIDKILPMIEELRKYAIYHFNTEEELMLQANSPNREFHVSQHSLFRKKFVNFDLAYNYKNRELINEIINFLRRWLILHICGVDINYSESVKKLLDDKAKSVTVPS